MRSSSPRLMTTTLSSVLTQKRNLRLLEMGDSSAATPSLDIRTVRGGFLVQAADMGEMGEWQTVTERDADRG